jgi:transcriptional regulator with XRE-family HTH domain
MIFADKLITLRKKAGWSQEELAEKLNVTRLMVGVLPQNDRPHRRSRADAKRRKDILRCGVDGPFRRSRRHKGVQFGKVRLCALLRKKRLPVGGG